MSKLFKSFKKGSKKILSVLTGGASKKLTDRPKAVPEPEPVAMPDEDEIRRARRKSLASQANRGGRASTVLTDDLDRLG
jgi:hypothetical protein